MEVDLAPPLERAANITVEGCPGLRTRVAWPLQRDPSAIEWQSWADGLEARYEREQGHAPQRGERSPLPSSVRRGSRRAAWGEAPPPSICRR